MGNPHVIFHCLNDPYLLDLERVGPLVENHIWFPKRINVHFVQFLNSSDDCEVSEAIVRTWERGSGITMACGTGASSVCVAGVFLGLSKSTLLAKLPGGTLKLDWPSIESSVKMTGPATIVFEGKIDLHHLIKSFP